MNWYKNSEIIRDINTTYQLKTTAEDYKRNNWLTNAILQETDNWKNRLIYNPTELKLIKEWLDIEKPVIEYGGKPYTLRDGWSEAITYWQNVAVKSTDPHLLKILSDLANESQFKTNIYALKDCFKNSNMPKEELVRTLKNTRVDAKTLQNIVNNPNTPVEVAESIKVGMWTTEEENLLKEIKDVVHEACDNRYEISQLSSSVGTGHFDITIDVVTDDGKTPLEQFIMVEKVSNEFYYIHVDGELRECDSFKCVIEMLASNVLAGGTDIRNLFKKHSSIHISG